ncbi:hypothetical protein GPALN_011470 [Globodera pallida]|nr:hypothetical protein GPALN_011470 [Globodera pallida]
MSSKSTPANEKSKISAGPTNFAKAASERSQTRRPKPKPQNSGVPMKKYSHSSIISTPTILWPKPTAAESAQIRPPESERLTRKPYNLLDANCALDDFAAIDDGTMLRNPQAQGRSQSFRHRPMPRTCGTATRTTPATADTSQERRRSTPTITRRCSLQNRARVEQRIDAWPEPKQRSEAEERFLALPDACDYTRVRQFNIDAKGAVIARGDSFRRKRQQQVVVHAQRSNPLATVNASSGGGGADTATEQNGDALSTASGGKLTERPASVGLPLHGASSRSASSVSSGGGGGGGVGPAAVGAFGIIADGDNTNKCMPPMAAGGVDEAASTSAATLRICLIGQSGSGKSSLIRRFISSEYRNVFADELPDDATCETQNCSVSINIGGHECDLNFTECDPQMACKQRDFHAYLLVYSIDRKTSFRVALRALEELREKHCPAPIILVGNKVDLERKRAVMENEVKNVVLTHDVPHFQVSVALNHDIDDLLVGIVAQIKEAFQMSISTNGGQNIRRISQASKDGFDSDFQAAIRRFSRRKKRSKFN